MTQFDSLLYPQKKMDAMRRAMAKARLRGEPQNRDERRRLNNALRELGFPELQVAAGERLPRARTEKVAYDTTGTQTGRISVQDTVPRQETKSHQRTVSATFSSYSKGELPPRGVYESLVILDDAQDFLK